jgi:hypothetical protein
LNGRASSCWMKVFFRALGAVLLVVAGLLLAPALGGG